MNIVVLSGNPKPASRTLDVALAVADGLVLHGPSGTSVTTVDLALVADRIFRRPDEVMDDLVGVVAAADLLLVASPTYKASYTGLLKGFLDRCPTDGLAGVVAVPIMTGGSDVHALTPEVFLRPLLVELGASVPTRGLYVVITSSSDPAAAVDDWLTSNRPLLASSSI